MPSPDEFARGMAVLQDRYNRTLQPPTMLIYRQLLDSLTDAEYRAGVALCIAKEEFFPTADMIRAYGKPTASLMLAAESAWDSIISACRQTPWQFIRHDRFDTRLWRAMGAVGGLRAIALAEPDAAPHVHRRFLEHYVELAEHDTDESRSNVLLAQLDPRAAALVAQTAKQIGGGA